LRRRPAKFHQHAVAQSLGIALARLCKSHDLLCENVVCQITAISKPKRNRGHFEGKAHDPPVAAAFAFMAVAVEPSGLLQDLMCEILATLNNLLRPVTFRMLFAVAVVL
jgi:hypothetical protein